MNWIGQGILYLGLYIVYSGTFGQQGARTSGMDWSIALPFILVGMAVVAAGFGISWAAMKSTQITLDTDASTRFKPNSSSNDSPARSSGTFSLFLRPFDITGKLIIEKAPSNLFSWDQYDRPGTDALERMLADAVQPTSPLIGLGAHGDIEFGPGTAGFVPDWKNNIADAMKDAAYIFIVPSANEGTLWEVGEIKNRDYVHKTVFIMPPTVSPFKFIGDGDYKEFWEAARTACAREHQIELPRYKPEGSLFLIDGKSAVREAAFQGFTPRPVAKAINGLMRN